MIGISLATCAPEVVRVPPVALLTGGFEERLLRVAFMGCQGIELMTARPASINWDAIQKVFHKFDLIVSAVASGPVAYQDGLTLLDPDPEIARQAAVRLNELIDLAEYLQAPLVTVGSLRGRAGGKNDMVRLTEILGQAAMYAASCGVRIALEPLNRYETTIIHTAAEALELINNVGSPALGLLLDTFHMNIEEPDPNTTVRLAAEAGRLWHIHIADSNRLPPGRGHFPFPALMENLAFVHYSGYLSAELIAAPDADKAAEETVNYLKALLGDTV